MNDPHIWWYVTRSSAILAWVLMTLSVVWGILLSTRVFRKVDSPGHLQDLHRYLGSLGLLMIVVHMVSLMLDGWLHFTPGQLLIPGHSLYRTIPVALGIVAFYLIVVVYGSSLLRDRLPPRFWKFLHYFNYVAVLLVAFHAGLTGTHAGRWWYLSASVVIISLTAIAIVVRIVLGGKPVTAGPRTVAPQTVAPQPTRVIEEAGPRPIEPPRTPPGVMTMVVSGIAALADGVRGVRLVPLGGDELPPWQPGAHATLQLPSGETRQYSLCGDPADRGFYEIAVLRDPHSRGGSAWMHEGLRLGMTIPVWEPRNHFPLVHANQYLFIAGGIGITPIRAMIESLPARREWRLIYLGRSRSTMAYLPELLERYPGQVIVYARDEHPDRLAIADLVRRLDGEVYCCGPEGLVDAVRSAADPAHFHAEHFVPVSRPAMIAGPLEIECARSGMHLSVPPDRSVLDVLEENRIPMVASCRRGVCGSCETRVVAGAPEHRDSVLDDTEKDELGIMFPCVSRSNGRLVLDL